MALHPNDLTVRWHLQSLPSRTRIRLLIPHFLQDESAWCFQESYAEDAALLRDQHFNTADRSLFIEIENLQCAITIVGGQSTTLLSIREEELNLLKVRSASITESTELDGLLMVQDLDFW